MQAQPSRDTMPEMALRRSLHRRGHRYRVHHRPLPGLNRTADIVFTRARVAVFVDGCFWHGCPLHGTRIPRVNEWYWPAKIARNKARDDDTRTQLEHQGWVVLRLWEHLPLDVAVAEVEQALVRSRHRLGRASRAR
jgi:DNA mismatch endonuclease (patch repair protein)